ncbi:MAG: hypothetical protein ACKVQS_12620 [Fimbriimonadaceae bacterium]
MTKSIVGIAVLSLSAIILFGCSGGEEEVPKESPTSQAAAQESASKWTPEQMEKFAELNKEARGQGAEGKGVTTDGTGK